MKKYLTCVGAAALALLISLAIVPCGVASAAADSEITIFVNGAWLHTDVPPRIINGRTMVPVRAISEAVGCRVEWVADARRVEVYNANGEFPLIAMYIDNPVVTVNKFDFRVDDFTSVKETIDSPPVIVDGRTLVPLRFIAEALDYYVDWDGVNRIVYLSSERNEAVSNMAVRAIVAGAGEDDLIAVVTNPSPKWNAALGEANRKLSTPNTGLPDEISILIPLKDGVQISVQSITYDPELDWFIPIETLHDFTAKLGEHYALLAHLPEGIPSLRVLAEYDFKMTVLYCTYDGSGDVDAVRYIAPEI